jgi:hypothetical protein
LKKRHVGRKLPQKPPPKAQEPDLNEPEAPEIADFRDPVDYRSLKSKLVDFGEAEPARGRREDIDDHLRMIAREFSGRPMILFYHAWLIVHIRRGRLEKAADFRTLWQSEPDYLMERLNTRWLVSACDTFADIGRDDGEAQIALAATLMMAVVKLYETERTEHRAAPNFLSFLGKSRGTREPAPFGTELFDGLTTFAVGQGDLVFNLFARINSVSGRTQSIPARILMELLRRLHGNDTVFRRMMDRHTNEGTRWDP